MKINFEDTTPTFGVKFTDQNETVGFNVGSTDSEKVSSEFGEVSEVSTNDHTRLLNRDVENQHPISAITGLDDELKSVPKETLSNMEIEALLK